MITKNNVPYELLVRWTSAGQIAGAHVQFLEQLVEDGTVINEKVGAAVPVALAGGAGFPLADILSLVQTDALATAAALTVQLSVAATERTTLQTGLSAMTAERDSAQVQLAAITAERDLLLAAPIQQAGGV